MFRNVLFFLTALLVPSLAYGRNPSADLSVQLVPSNGTSVIIGGSIGFLMAVLSGLASYVLLSVIDKKSEPRSPLLQWLFGPRSAPSGFRVAAKLGRMLPALWFGGSWLTLCVNSNWTYPGFVER